MLTSEAYRLEATQALLPFKPKRIFLEKPLVARGGQAHVVPVYSVLIVTVWSIYTEFPTEQRDITCSLEIRGDIDQVFHVGHISLV